ncbi:hypothetical protein CC78DRAFT_547382 [Lojkania enalia]|uniref:DUF7704 domain-containing protein n=1 Tax=Lojkania enalia TaxID=147567 RepID=A0A9P4MZQ7_9PLEO|nr:hypothetical protein CC78DRAFT_547382 [Didymosphaeria enalia]
MAQSSHPIPAPYRIFFTFIDPVIGLGGGAYPALIDPDLMMSAFFPASHPWSRRTPSHTMLLHQLGGFYILCAFLQIFMLRYTTNVNIWNFLQDATLFPDITMYYGYWVVLGAQERLSADKLRLGEWAVLLSLPFVP